MIGNLPKSKQPLLFGLIALLLFASAAAARGADQGAPQPQTVCIQCHSSLQGPLGAPVNLWRKSIHSENGISCNNCHGGDPQDPANAMNPARGFLGAPKEANIPAFCGRCHVGVLKDYLGSAHGQRLGKGGPTCVTCHSNHLVLKASLNIINEKTCTQCHTFERARVIKAAMQQTEGYIINIDRRINELQKVGIDTESMAKQLFAVRNQFHTLFHDVNVDRVRGQSTQINAQLAKLDNQLKGIEDALQRRKIAGGVAIFCALVLALLFHLLKKTYD